MVEDHCVRFAAVVNLNHGPFRSGAWGKAKQEAHAHWMSTHTVDSPDFLAAADKTATELPQHAGQTYAFWWDFVNQLASCVEAGPVLKFARSMSIQEAWYYYRPQMWFLREILTQMNPTKTMELIKTSTTSMLDAELAETLTTSKTGLLADAPVYITKQLLDCMDMFVAATFFTRLNYTVRAKQVKSPQEAVKHPLFAHRKLGE